MTNDADLLKDLAAGAPNTLRPQRKSTLFEAIHVLDLENPHFDFLAWLLDPQGPLADGWLLKSLMKRVAPDQTWTDGVVVEPGSRR